MSYEDRELEALLRQALAEEAGRIEPAGDGLRRIRERTAGERWRARWLRWSTPALALAGAAAVIAAIAVLPQVVPDEPTPSVPAAGGTSIAPTTQSVRPTGSPTGTPASPSPSRAPSGSPTTAPGSPSPSGSAPVQVPDMPTSWPYATRHEGGERADADVRDGTYPRLPDAVATAVDFVASYLGPDGLTAARLAAHPPGVRVLVRRYGQPLSTVFLVRVRGGSDAPYVVVSASRAGLDDPDTLTISAPPAVPDTSGFVAQGTVRREAGEPDPQLVVQLRVPGATRVLARAEVTVALEGKQLVGWSATLTPSAVPSPGGVVAAWTVDAEGQPLEFVAAPTATD